MDPIANMLIMLKNASMVGKDFVVFPRSQFKLAILECLKKEGYIKDVVQKDRKDFPILEVALLYDENQKPKISNVKRISKPSRRVYFGMKNIHSVLGGHGLLILSTPKGILSGKSARKEQVGGEALFKIW